MHMRAVLKYLPIVCVMLLWGSMGIPSTFALKEVTPLGLLCARSGIGAAVLFPFVWKKNGSLLPEHSERSLILILALIGVVLCNYFYFYALSHTTLTNVAILYATGPLITAILAAVFLGERIAFGRAAGIGLAFFGVVLLLTNGRISDVLRIQFNQGDLMEFCSAICLAIYTVLSRRLKKTPAECVVFWLMLSSFAMSFPLTLFSADGFGQLTSVRGALSVLYLGALCSGIGYLLQQVSIRLCGAASTAAFLNGISPVTVLSAGLILKEQISILQFISMFFVFAGLYLNASNWTFSHSGHIINHKKRIRNCE